jgi:hypothetical protein
MKRILFTCLTLSLLLLISCMNPQTGSHGGTDRITVGQGTTDTDGATVDQDTSDTVPSTSDIATPVQILFLETGSWEMDGAWFDDDYVVGIACIDGEDVTVLVVHNGSLEATDSNPYDAYRIEYDAAALIKQEGTYDFADNTVTYTYRLDTVITISPTLITHPEKPVIYLYPEAETAVTVTVDFKGDLTVTIPPYENGWTVTASPDGTLTDQDGKTYPYLFWEGITSVILPMDEGFCVKGKDTEAFLLDILPRLGLIEHEYSEFIDYWLPRMEGNAYNVITFQTDAYEAIAPLTVSPAPDAVLRVYMSFRPSETPVNLPEQEIESFTRHGFTVVEWGGEERK